MYFVNSECNWALEVKIEDTASLREKLFLVSNDTTQHLYIIVSFEEERPVKAPCDVLLLNDISVLSDLTGSSAQNSVQVNFRERVLFRDNCCVFCGYGKKAALKAAQIFDVFHADDRVEYNFAFLCQYGIMNLYDTQNGLTLCSHCYDMFDALLCCVVVEYDATGSAAVYKLAIAEAIKNSPQFAGKRTKFDGSLLRVPTDSVRRKYWPPEELFKYRESKFHENSLKLHAMAIEFPEVCCVCGKRCKSASGLTAHQGSGACLSNIMKKNRQIPTMYTPAAGGQSSISPKKSRGYRRPSASKKGGRKNRK